ncbi:MAG: hypothetical protein K5930_07675 [Treponemataceae bacterium]|nr:hypothetical protein [Treponemataceae bacterium]
MFDTPILFIVFNRLDTVKIVFERIKEIQPKQLFIAADGARLSRPEEKEKCDSVRNWIDNNISWDCDVERLYRESNLGCRDAVYGAIKWFFENVDQGIILEDDCLPDKSFFPYCEQLLLRYKNNPNIGLISGRNNCNKAFSNANESYQFTSGGGIWGWATWSRVFKDFNPLSLELYHSKDLNKKIYSFTKDKEETSFLLQQLDLVLKNHSTWDYQWGLYLKYNHLISITPSQNLVHNIGFEGESTHYTNSNLIDIPSHSLQMPLKHPAKIRINYKLSKEMASHCFPRKESILIRLIRKIRQNIKK